MTTSEVTFTATAGVTYHIAVGAAVDTDPGADVVLSVTGPGTVAVPPAPEGIPPGEAFGAPTVGVAAMAGLAGGGAPPPPVLRSGTCGTPGSLITGPSQIEWAGRLLLGDGTELFVTDLTGWDSMPPVDSGNVPRAGRNGSWPGRAYAQERVVTAEFDVLPESLDTRELLAAIRAATTLAEDGEECGLVVWADDDPPLVAFGQVHRRDLPMAQGFRRRVEGAAIQWTCSDPRRYSLDEQTREVGARTGSTGLVFPLTFPLDFGDAGPSGAATVVNAGEAPAHPLLVITGPAVRPRVVNTATGDLVEFDLSLAAGEQLVIDTNRGTALLGGVANRLFTLTAASVPLEAFTLAPGENPLALRAESFGDGAALSVTWRSASW